MLLFYSLEGIAGTYLQRDWTDCVCIRDIYFCSRNCIKTLLIITLIKNRHLKRNRPCLMMVKKFVSKRSHFLITSCWNSRHHHNFYSKTIQRIGLSCGAGRIYSLMKVKYEKWDAGTRPNHFIDSAGELWKPPDHSEIEEKNPKLFCECSAPRL